MRSNIRTGAFDVMSCGSVHSNITGRMYGAHYTVHPIYYLCRQAGGGRQAIRRSVTSWRYDILPATQYKDETQWKRTLLHSLNNYSYFLCSSQILFLACVDQEASSFVVCPVCLLTIRAAVPHTPAATAFLQRHPRTLLFITPLTRRSHDGRRS